MPDGKRRPRLLSVFAHPDDETFCAGGTLAKYAAAGAESMVVSATRGQCGQIRDARAATRATLGEVRERELVRACKELGVEHAVCLDYMDGTLNNVHTDVLVGEIVSIIRRFRPDVVITFDSSGAYGHLDHIAISRATTRACEVAGDPAHFPAQIENGLAPQAPAALYHSLFVPTHIMMLEDIAEWLVSLGPRFRASDEFVQMMSFFAKESTTLQYASDHVQVNWYPPGTYIIEQGETGSSLYLILSGEVDIIREEEDGSHRTLARKGAGEFFGEMALARRQPRNAHVVVVHSVTCLVLSSTAPTAFAGRGSDATLGQPAMSHRDEFGEEGATTCIDVSEYVNRKIAALAAHRTQYPIQPDLFPPGMLVRMLGREYFVRIRPRIELEKDLFPLSTVSVADWSHAV